MATVFLTAAVAIGSSVAANLIQGTSKPDSGNIDVPKSNYGVVLPQCWGTVEIAGNLLWASKIKKKKGKKRKNFGDFAMLFAHCPFNPAQEIELLKFNNKGGYSTITPDENAVEASLKFRDRYFRFYLGTANQTPDPLIEAKTPVSNVVLSDNHADAIAQKHLHKAWLEQLRVKFTLPPSMGYLEFGDRPKIPLINDKY